MKEVICEKAKTSTLKCICCNLLHNGATSEADLGRDIIWLKLTKKDQARHDDRVVDDDHNDRDDHDIIRLKLSKRIKAGEKGKACKQQILFYSVGKL